jgi:gentisate 1,2-dioxygenase
MTGGLIMEAVQKTPEREAFYRKIDGENLSALWNVLGDLVTPEPRSACRPHLWKFDSIRDYMTEAGKLITAKEAERRVLVLENPGLRGQSKVTTSLFAGVQMVVPGDVAPAHRHSQSALRFVLEGKGAHTTVDGERTAMEPGDFVITPSMTWHDHSNETSEPMFWLDGLDIPMVQFFDASFAEGSNEDQQKISKPAGDSFARYGHNPAAGRREAQIQDLADLQLSLQLHARGAGAGQDARRMGRLPWAEAEILQPRDRRFRDADDRHLHPAIAEGLQDRALPRDRRHRVRRDRRQGPHPDRRPDFRMGPRDLFVVPSWHWVTHEADTDSVLFSFSDRPVQQKLDLFAKIAATREVAPAPPSLRAKRSNPSRRKRRHGLLRRCRSLRKRFARQ